MAVRRGTHGRPIPGRPTLGRPTLRRPTLGRPAHGRLTSILAGLLLTGCAVAPTTDSTESTDGITWDEACPQLVDEPVEQLAATVLPDGSVELTWFDGYVTGDFHARLYRKPAGEPWRALADVRVAEGGAARHVDGDAPDGPVQYRLRRVLDCGENGVLEGDPLAGGREDDAVTASPAPEGWRSPATTLDEHCAAIRPRDVRAEVTPDGVLLTWYDGDPPDSDAYRYAVLRRPVGADEWEVFDGVHAPVAQASPGTIAGEPPLRSFLDESPPTPLPEYGVEHDDGPCYPVEVVSAGVPVG